jgi:hypothetical protein
MMIDYFEVNKSQRATCKRCGQPITDHKRGVEETTGFGHKEYKYYCIPCSGEIIKSAKKELSRLEQSMRFALDKIRK